mmetsp:Transcript_9494/g.27761  ORF Transcript_9494/g.27761 Transcript_9494/m.27761 type:complete len:705 (-) Transcript_9494:702-2816(-)
MAGFLRSQASAASTAAAPEPPRSPISHDHRAAKEAADKELHHSHHSKKHRSFYVPAVRLLEWGEVQKGRHASWGDLFFDLIMVGAAFKVGNYYKKYVDIPEGPLVLAGCMLTILNSWSHLLQYRCRFEAKSIVHKMVDVAEGLFTAASAHNVIENKEAFENYHQYAFVAMAVMVRLVQAGRRLELVLQPADPSEIGSTRYAALDMLVRMLVESLLLCCAFAFRTTQAVMAWLIGIWVVEVLVFTTPVVKGWYRKKYLVPIHVEYTVRRMGEMVMLMLGEGMLSLVISESDLETEGAIQDCDSACWTDKVKAGVSFLSGFIILSSLMWCYFRSNRFTRHHHAVRRSALRGIAWNTSHWPLSVSLVSAGVCIKAIHPQAASKAYVKYTAAFAASLCISILIMAFEQLMHPGVDIFLRAPRERARRLAFFCARVAGALALLVMPAFHAEGYIVMLYACVLCVFCVALLVLEKSPAIERGLWHFADNQETDHHYHHRGDQAHPPSEHPYQHRRHHSRQSHGDALDSSAVILEEGGLGAGVAHGHVHEGQQQPRSGGATPHESKPGSMPGGRTPPRSGAVTPPRRAGCGPPGISRGSSMPVDPAPASGVPGSREAVVAVTRARSNGRLSDSAVHTGRGALHASIVDPAAAADGWRMGSDSESDTDSDDSTTSAPAVRGLGSRRHTREPIEREDQLTEEEDFNTAVVLQG